MTVHQLIFSLELNTSTVRPHFKTVELYEYFIVLEQPKKFTLKHIKFPKKL